jgi:hypothetical protein
MESTPCRALAATVDRAAAGCEPQSQGLTLARQEEPVERPQDSQQKPERSRGIGRAVWVAYLSTGVALAIFRVSLRAWVEHQRVSHRMTETVYDLLWLLRPELLLLEFNLIHGVVPDRNPPDIIFWGLLLTLGSFILAMPILWVGWLRQRRRYLVGVAALAVTRITVLAGVAHRFGSERMNEVFHHLRWALFPEALLVTHTVFGQMSISWMMTLLVGSVVLLWGSVVLATPILMVDHLAQRRR